MEAGTMVKRPVGKPKRELFPRNGIFYARFRRPGGKKDIWSTGTSDPTEAARRLEFMRVKNQPWKAIADQVDHVADIYITPDGSARATLIRREVVGTEILQTTETLEPIDAVKKLQNLKNPPKPEDEPIDLCRLLNEEFELKKREEKPEGTLKYFETRFKFLKEYVTQNDLTLATFDQKAALDFIQWRLRHIPHAETQNGKGKHKNGYNARPAKAPTVNQEIMMFRNAWRQWQGEGKIGANPWTRIKHLPETGTAEEIAANPYTLDEIKSIFDKITNETIRNILIFQLVLGTRPGRETTRITSEMVEAGKIWSHKKKRWDNFDYSDEAKEFFKTKIEGKINGIQPRYVRSAFQKACKKAGVRVGTPYDLRHAYGTESLKRFDIEVVSKLLRHSEIRTTQIYAKVRSEDAKTAHETMQHEILSKVQEKQPQYNQ